LEIFTHAIDPADVITLDASYGTPSEDIEFNKLLFPSDREFLQGATGTHDCDENPMRRQ